MHFRSIAVAFLGLSLACWAPFAAATPEAKVAPDAAKLVAWLRPRLPPGGVVAASPHKGRPEVLHVAHRGDTVDTIAASYLDLTDVYLAADLASLIAHENGTKHGPLAEGARLTIPRLVARPYETGDKARLPAGDLATTRGLYVRGSTAGAPQFMTMLDRMADRGIEQIVLDAKDYDGLVTYPSRVQLANDAGAVQHHPPIANLARTIRFAHRKGIRVAVRVSCFEDELMAKARPALSVQSKAKRAYPIGWLEPSNPEVHAYIIELVREALDAGADEIQLDYVRYPVLGIKNADFHLAERGLTKPIVIRDFVRKVHAVTHARKVPLTLDVFGVISLGKRADIDSLGQDPNMLARECEVLAPMVYPSHFAPGFYGWEEPGSHPEIVGIATKATLAQIDSIKGPRAVIRPWLQAMGWKSPGYSPGYLATEVKKAHEAGGSGWLMWNPGQDYGYAWMVVKKRD